jgi:hypothetical protein
LAKTGVIAVAAREAEINYTTATRLRKTNPEFAKKVQEAIDHATDLLEEEVRRRAQDGYQEPVFQKGEQVGEVTKYSDSLATFLLRSRAARFRQDAVAVKHEGEVGMHHTGTVQHKVDLSGLDDEELEALHAIAKRLSGEAEGTT